MSVVVLGQVLNKLGTSGTKIIMQIGTVAEMVTAVVNQERT